LAHVGETGSLGGFQHFPSHRRIRKTALFLRESPSIPLLEVPVHSTSPKLAKSPCYFAK
jgi:hypothetical protein